jgi:methionyl-tRNA formyltransferase
VNILFIGSSGALSLFPFKQLLASIHTVSAVGVVNPISFDKKIIALKNESLALAATALNIPVIDLAQPVRDIVDLCEAYSIDVILMSCYNKRLPDEIINLAIHGCYNMHPSLLPYFRGPEPIFWQMKMAADIGVSWHKVVNDFDAGDIVAQQKVLLDDGVKYSSISLQLAETGSALMLALLSDITEDAVVLSPQNSAIASYYRYPENQDFAIDLNSSAQQLYNFICATKAFAVPHQCHIGNHLFYLDEALDYDNNRTLDTLEVQGNRLYIPCNEGVLIASHTDKIPL